MNRAVLEFFVGECYDEHRCLSLPLWVCNVAGVCVKNCVLSITLFCFPFFSCVLRNVHRFLHPAVMDICIVCRHAFFNRFDAGDHHTGLLSCPPVLFNLYLFVLVVCLQRAGPSLPAATHAHKSRSLAAAFASKCGSGHL